jgi:hypothetical protein
MKIVSKISLLLLAAITIFSCGELDELTEFDITQDFSTTVNVDITDDSDGEPQSWSQSSTINLADNDEIQANLDLVQDVNINSLTFKIINFIGVENAIATEATLSFGDTIIDIEDINLQDNTTIYSIGTSSELNAIANDLKNTSEVTVTVSGTVTSTPVKFDVVITFDVTTTFDVI